MRAFTTHQPEKPGSDLFPFRSDRICLPVAPLSADDLSVRSSLPFIATEAGKLGGPCYHSASSGPTKYSTLGLKPLATFGI